MHTDSVTESVSDCVECSAKMEYGVDKILFMRMHTNQVVLSSFCHTIYRFFPPSVSVAACILKLISTLVLYNGKTNDNEVLKDLTKLLKQFETKVPIKIY